MKNLVLVDCDAQTVLILVSQYLRNLKSSKMPVKPDTLKKYQRIYDTIGQQIEQQGGIGYFGDI